MNDDVEWLDGDGHDEGTSEELSAGRRRPHSRGGRVLVGVIGAALVAGVVVAAVTGSRTDRPRAQATPSRSSTTTVSAGPSSGVFQPNGPSATALVAIRAAFGGAKLDSYVTVEPKSGDARPTDFYNLRTRNRKITVVIAPLRQQDPDTVDRTARSVRIAQSLGSSARIDVTVTTTAGPTSQRDFAAIQELVQDGRLLVPRGRATMAR